MIGHGLRLVSIGGTLMRYRLDELLEHIPGLKLMRVLRWLPWTGRGMHDRPLGLRLRLALQELGPIYVKFGQVLSTRRDLLPSDIADELALLQDAVAPFSSEHAQQIIEAELGQPLTDMFADFEREPLASASIAQVHGATLADGRAVVVKVVRPGIEQQLRTDLRLLHTLARLGRRHHPEGERLRPDELVSEFERVLYTELDMQSEAANAAMMRRNFEDSQELYIPEIEWSLTAQRVLVMERVYGVPVRDIAELKRQGVNLNHLAQLSIRLFYTQVFRDNLFHADMHPGNILVDTSDPQRPSFIALDFGIVASLSQKDLYYIGENFLAIFNRQYRRVAELHVQAGWVPADTRIDELEAATRTVSEPNFTRPLEEVSFAELLIALFSVARRFKLTLQPQLIMLQKTLLNIEGMARELDPSLNMWEVAKPELESIYRQQYGLQRTAERLGQRLPSWLSRSPELPNMVFEAVRMASSGQLRARIDSSELALLAEQVGRHNRRLPGAVVAAGLLVAGAVLWSQDLAPVMAGVSVPAAISLLAGLLIGWRSLR
jgi:ubiquinone biosynthesis protein